MRIEIPTKCPCCDYTLIFVNEQLYCKNASCSAQLSKKLEHFTKTLGIKGLGPKTLERLNLESLLDIFYMECADLEAALGSEKTAQKLFSEISKAKIQELSTVLASFSIPLLGNTASSKLCSVVKNFDEITQETCKLAGLGDKVTANLLNWLETEYQDLKEFMPFEFKSKSTTQTSTTGVSVCITGKLLSFKTKAEAYAALESAGYTVSESVTKNLSILVDEQNKESAKRKKATEYGITIVNNLYNFLKENTK